MSGTVDDSTDILARCASTFSAGGLCALTFRLDSGMTTGPSCDFGETALRAVVTMNGLSSPVTASSLSKLLWSVTECMTKGGAVDDSADILAACDGTISPEGLRVSTSVLESGVVTKTSTDLEGLRFRQCRYSSPLCRRLIWFQVRQQPNFDFGSDALQGASFVNGLSIPVTANRGGNGAGL